MTREELREHCEKQVEACKVWAKHRGEEPHGKIYEEHKLILELLEQETVSKEVYDHEYFLRKEFEMKIAKLESILDKIRAEIEEYKSRQLTLAIGVADLEKGKQIALEYVLAILDKYKGEITCQK